ncbi:MAG: hypothetical protein JO053_16505 [Acidobacteria bacterium]|nr:hypothetical protein [Acidobacteriota bacterium]
MKIKFGSNFAVFLLFFGLAALDAVKSQDWLRSALWVALGLVFLFADSFPSRRQV